MNLRTERAEEVRHVEFRASDGADGQTLEGYAAVFNEWTDIRDASGTYRERIAPGAFKRSLGQRTPVLQFDHGTHPLIGSLPLGSFTVLREDRNGLFVRARLSDNWLVQPVRDAIRDKAITGMSFRFRVIADTWGTEDGGDTRTISEVELLEAGPVVFPAYEQTTVAVRSLVEHLDDDTRAVLAHELVAAAHTDDDTAGKRMADALSATADEISADLAAADPVVDVAAHVRSLLRRDIDVNGPGVLDTLVGRSGPELLNSTTSVAEVPADNDSPDEPPVESHEANRTRIADALARFREHSQKETD